MDLRRTGPALLLAAGLALAATGCEAAEGSTIGAGDRSGGNADAQQALLPRLVGQGLRSAQQAASDAGFRKVRTHDALGRDRAQAFSRNWQVCFQAPSAGTHSTGTEIDLGTVKLDETCPAEDRRPQQAGDRMPNFAGKSLRAARGALDPATGITTEDATGKGRIIVLESNWRVCGQEPAAGGELAGRPVAFTAVKYGESCP